MPITIEEIKSLRGVDEAKALVARHIEPAPPGGEEHLRGIADSLFARSRKADLAQFASFPAGTPQSNSYYAGRVRGSLLWHMAAGRSARQASAAHLMMASRGAAA
jgi:hypothetical protein